MLALNVYWLLMKNLLRNQWYTSLGYDKIELEIIYNKLLRNRVQIYIFSMKFKHLLLTLNRYKRHSLSWNVCDSVP